MQHQGEEPPRTIEQRVELEKVAQESEGEPGITLSETKGKRVPICQEKEGNHETWNHESPQFLHVLPQKRKYRGGLHWTFLILHHQTITTEEEEDGHSVMSEMGKDRSDHAPHILTVVELKEHPLDVASGKRELVFCYGTWQEMQQIVQHDAQDGDAL